MRIITKVYKAIGKHGPYEIRISRIRGLRLRKPVYVLRNAIDKGSDRRKTC